LIDWLIDWLLCVMKDDDDGDDEDSQIASLVYT